jgi:hypothetical protein
MKHKLILFIFVLNTLIGGGGYAFAQNFPVDCRVLLSPPYTGKFTDITNSPTKFRVQLLLKDLTKSSIDISLRIRLKGQGVWLENPEGFITSKPITLTPGVPKTFSALELAEYFAPQNIEAQGIDYAQLLNGLPLPFGFYEWEVVAIELYRNREVSNVGRGKFYIQNNYPPLLNMPRDESIVPAIFPQNLLFSWTPRHITPALGTGGLLYHLYLYEIPEDDTSISSAADIQALINSGTPYMQELLSDKPYYNYGASNLPLTAGKRYAWQVRVESFGENDGFLNDGYSDIKSFVYGHLPCPRPTNLQAKVDADDGSVALTWDAPTDALSFKIAYNAQPSGIKTERSILEKNYLLIQQPRGFTYAWQVQSVCQQGQSEPSKETFELNEAPQDSAWISDPNLTYTPKQDPKPDPDVLQTTDDEGINETTETSPEENLDEILNTPVKIYIPAEGKELPEGVPSSLTTLPANATVEQLQEVLKSKKPNCAGISASYSCGNHDSVPQYSGSIVSVAAGDEIAMNSMVLSIVSIDGNGNGEGLIKVPMMNNIKLGVTLSGIQVAEGGCVVAGRAELSGVSASVLTDKQRATLEKAYAAYNQVLDLAYENAGAIAETYNSLTELYEKIAQKTQAILDKVNDGKKISKAEQKALAEMKKKAKEGIDKQIAYFTKKFGSGGSDEIINLVNLASQSCACEAYTETTEPKKGPNVEVEEWVFYDDDCKKCLEDDKKKQEEMAKLAKALEDKLKAIKDKKMECGCFKLDLQAILHDFSIRDKNCELLIQYLTQIKTNIDTKQNTVFDVAEGALHFPLQGQVNIGGECFDDVTITLGKSVINPQKKQYLGDILLIDGAFNLKTENIEKTKLLQKWLYSALKEEKKEEEKEMDKKVEILDNEAYKKYAKIAGVKDFLAYKAFTIVESGGNGFFEYSGKNIPKLLFERHLMYKCLKNGKIWSIEAKDDPRKDKSIDLDELLKNRPEIVAKEGFNWCKKCNEKKLPNTYILKGESCATQGHDQSWFNKECYISTKQNYEDRFLEAVKIHKECAYMSTSWGLGQVIGANFRNEFSSIDDMEKLLMNGTESSQLLIMSSFIKNNPTLQNAINTEDWSTAAREYNGDGYAKNKYDENLKKQYEELKKEYKKLEK